MSESGRSVKSERDVRCGHDGCAAGCDVGTERSHVAGQLSRRLM